MRSLLICLAALLGVVLSTSVAAPADTAAAPASSTGEQPGGSAAAQAPDGVPTEPRCGDPFQPEAVENPKVSIVLDPKTAWKPRGGTAVPQAATQPECTADGLTNGLAYDFRVAAVNATGQGLWSAVVTARTLRNPQWADLVVTGDGRGEVDVTRAQMLFFTLVAAFFVGMKVLTSYVIPDIPQGILLLMGISNGAYLTAKFIPD